ncbi:putative membrane protein YphA (DoxX/SURF4 family) [Spirilliplanes yamanashiensis]|nr:putative membrane protein YphA (DoxX/SURF4 family) [Spirilliplanes yamanashiensis]
MFVASGARALANPAPMVDRAKPVTDRVTPLLERTDPRIPTDTATLVRLNGAVQLGAGLLLATGRATRPAALALAASLVPTTLAGHRFWEFSGPERTVHQNQFVKNLGLLGGLLLAAADTEGRPGLRYRAEHFVDRRQRGVKRAVRTARREAKIAAASAAMARRLPG